MGDITLPPPPDEKKYPKALHGNYYGMSREDLSEVFAGAWDDQLIAVTAHVIKNHKASKAFLPELKKSQMFSLVKQIMSKLWVDNVLTMTEVDNLYEMFMSPDEDNMTMAMEIMKVKFPRELNKRI